MTLAQARELLMKIGHFMPMEDTANLLVSETTKAYKQVRSTNAGYCFKAAGWGVCGETKARKLVILEREANNKESHERSKLIQTCH